MLQRLFAYGAFAANKCPLSPSPRPLDLEHAGHRTTGTPIEGGRSGVAEILVGEALSLLLCDSIQEGCLALRALGVFALLGLKDGRMGVAGWRMSTQGGNASLIGRSSWAWIGVACMILRTMVG